MKQPSKFKIECSSHWATGGSVVSRVKIQFIIITPAIEDSMYGLFKIDSDYLIHTAWVTRVIQFFF